MKRILLVDDDDTLRDSLIDQLGLYEEFEAVGVGSGAEALESAKAQAPDLVLLDVGLPDLDGCEVCRLLRRAGVKVPVIMLTGADSEADTIFSLDAGANDYVPKPFRLGALLTRIRAQLSQHEQSEDAVFTIGPYVFNPSAKQLVDEKRNVKVRLTEKEAEILKCLYRMGKKVITREVLLDEIWGYNSGVATHTLETHIYRLRQKIEPDPANAQILVTKEGGYRLVP